MEEIISVALGLIIGSFLNVVIHRVPLEKSIISPGSHCPSCNKPVRVYDNIPVLSYILLGAECRHCKAGIAIRYPLVEAFTGFSFWLAYISYRPDLVHAIFAAIFISLLLALALIDLEHMILPLEMTIGGAVLFLAYSFFSPYITPFNAFASAIVSALVFAAIYFFYIKVRKKEGLGQGDIWMMLLMGSFLGANKLVIAIFLASFSGAIIGILLIIFKKKDMSTEIPFGTFLSLGSYLSLFWGIEILKYVQSIFKIG